MRLFSILALAALAILALIGLNSFYTVRQDFQALVLNLVARKWCETNLS